MHVTYSVAQQLNNPAMQDCSKETCNPGDAGSVSEWGRFPGEGNGKPLQYSCWENLMDRGAWWATIHRVAKSQTQRSTEQNICVVVVLILTSLSGPTSQEDICR